VAITNYLRVVDFFAVVFFTDFLAAPFFALFGALIALVVRWLVTLIGPVSITESSGFKFSITLF
jgi:hypothetical protein